VAASRQDLENLVIEFDCDPSKQLIKKDQVRQAVETRSLQILQGAMSSSTGIGRLFIQ
jgi:hypothetical protein